MCSHDPKHTSVLWSYNKPFSAHLIGFIIDASTQFTPTGIAEQLAALNANVTGLRTEVTELRNVLQAEAADLRVRISCFDANVLNMGMLLQIELARLGSRAPAP